MSDTKFLLDESDIPRAWYNIMADLPTPPPPPLHPGTGQPIGPADLAPLFPMALIMQEVSTERAIEIPEQVRRSTGSGGRRRCSARGGWRRRSIRRRSIYYKYEGVSPAGSHKPNTAVAQAYYNKQEGVKRLATETGAGQWGSALAMAGAFFGLEVQVYMVKVSYEQKPYRRALMETFGARVRRQPERGDRRRARRSWPSTPTRTGSLGIAISRGGRGGGAATTTPSTRWAAC